MPHDLSQCHGVAIIIQMGGAWLPATVFDWSALPNSS
jgi:hypothetical protein